MVQQRKTTTYGKSARRPIPAISAFAEASEHTTTYSQQEDNTWRETGPKSKDERSLRFAEKTQRLPLENETVASKKNSRLDPQSIETPIVCTTDDRSSDEEVHDGHPFSENTGARKRRKLTPDARLPVARKIIGRHEPQHHATTDSRGGSTKKTLVPGEAHQKSKDRLGSARRDPDASKNKDLLDIDDRTIASRSTSIIVPSVGKGTPVKRDNGASVASRMQDDQRALSNLSTSGALNDEEIRGKPRRSPVTAKTLKSQNKSLAQRPGFDEPQDLDMADDFLPRTPPKPPKISSGMTTPKQQELWHKVLADDFGGTRRERNGEDQKQNEINQASGLPHDELKTAHKFGERSVKLIDFLTSSTRDRSTSDSDCSEDHGSSGPERSKSAQPDAATNEETLKMQTSPGIKNHSKSTYHVQERGPIPAHQIVPSVKGVPKVTYIRERTHLEESDFTNTPLLEVPPVAGTEILSGHQRRGAGILQTESSLLNSASQNLDELEGSQAGPMRSIHELREAGGNTRVAGELDAILGDLEDCVGSSNTTRRSSLLSLASKLLDASICRMLIDQGLEARFLAQMNSTLDIFERSLLAASLLQILFNTTSTVFLSQTNHLKIINLLVGLLDQTEDLPNQVKLRGSRMSKLAQTEFVAFYGAFSRLPVWRISKPPVLCGQILALQCLDILVHQAREASWQSAIPSSDALSRIAETSIPLPGTKYSQSPCSRICLELAIAILEASTKGETPLYADNVWTAAALERISEIFPLLAEGLVPESNSLHSLTLRLYLNLTNASPELCEMFTKCQILRAVCRSMFHQFDLLLMPDHQPQDPQILEILVLSLGYMINLAEFSDTMRAMMMELETGEQKSLDILLQAFLKRNKATTEAYSEAEAQINVAFGYLSILLSYLCLNSKVRSYINHRTEGPDVKTLLDALEEFLKLHKQIDDGLQRGNGGTDQKLNFVGRLQILADELRRFA